eukprot:TRINITY_DN22119_c0_g1_i1.p1 TRINITY_DN22119_c0_g1~~TRINITY_DN22119_c0_g1_i1.p1  ORF type:complete len:372 (-),score=39.26 TRINITY_DN22119_c0_g1_i1:177-1292(-)
MASQEWPSPFWAGKLDEWLQPPILEWCDAELDQPIRFQAVAVQPEYGKKINAGWWPGGCTYRRFELPLVFFFGGMDCPPGLESLGIHTFAKSVSKPCVVVAPFRPKGRWWVLDRGGEFGYIDGELQPQMVKGFASWMRDLCKMASKEGSVDGERPRAFGFSAGAYALTEILVHSSMKQRIWSLALGGLHGHGQPEVDDVPNSWRRRQAVEKFDAYLERVRRHPGVPGGLFLFHHPEDNVCPWRYARKIAEALNARQTELGHAAMQIEELWELDKSSRATTARQQSQGIKPQMHGYQNTAFLNDRFLCQFLHAADSNGSNHDTYWKGSSRSRSRPVVRLKPRVCSEQRSRSDSRRRQKHYWGDARRWCSSHW